ncbi:hypothetical protein HNQ80_002912 [Anaerosolibacter carboniphilus]|uniref:Uncharacterized protein n=1 Tax=Anaerosolibacter carboniphilus TaxID=1417629 RepID=A0A841KX32_9FIRM|nr:hypothetical protein [Anaerosolibacter carboniphilus]
MGLREAHSDDCQVAEVKVSDERTKFFYPMEGTCEGVFFT